MTSFTLMFGCSFLTKYLTPPFFHLQSWLKKAEWIDSLAPLPEGPRTALLTAMLAVEPYKAPEKKEKKEEKEAREGLRYRGPPDTRSEDTHAPSTLEGEKEHEEEGEESESSRTRKKAASKDAEKDQPPPAQKRQCRAKVALSGDNSASVEDSEAFEEVPRRTRRVKPQAQRYISDTSPTYL
jgi:hypothetical protein